MRRFLRHAQVFCFSSPILHQRIIIPWVNMAILSYHTHVICLPWAYTMFPWLFYPGNCFLFGYIICFPALLPTQFLSLWVKKEVLREYTHNDNISWIFWYKLFAFYPIYAFHLGKTDNVLALYPQTQFHWVFYFIHALYTQSINTEPILRYFCTFRKYDVTRNLPPCLPGLGHP